jgi:drug/metabolite transporter (DMT)-like permease
MAMTTDMAPTDTRGPTNGAEVSTMVWLGVMVVLWGLSWPAMKVALGMVPPLWLATLRFATSGACLFALMAVRGTLRLPSLADLPIIASVGGLQMMSFTALGLVAMQYTDAGHAALLAYTTPLWGVITAWAILRQVPTRWQMLALIVGMAGIALICSPWEMDWRRPGVIMGNAFLLLGAICWSLTILHVRRHRWVMRPIELAPWQMLFATVPLVVLSAVFEGVPHGIAWTPKLGALLLFIGPVATSACFVISTEFGRRVTTFAMSNLTLGVPVIGIVASAMLLGNHIGPLFATGLTLIVAGVVLAALSIGRSAPARKPQTVLPASFNTLVLR